MTADAISPHRKGTNVSPSMVRGFQFMFRKRLVATVAAAPLLLFAGAALAETTITDTRTAGVTTGTIAAGGPDDIKITTAGKIKPTVAGAAVTVNTNNKVVNEGEISTKDVSNSTGILINPGVTTTVTNKGTISITDSYEAKDDDKDDDLDGEFATGSGRYGIRVAPGGTVTGDIINDASTITIEGNDSAGISVESNLTGNLSNTGTIAVTGDNTYGIHTTGNVSGNVTVRGAVATVGENTVGVAIDGDVGGGVRIQGAVNTRGFRYNARPTDLDFLKGLDADDLLLGGPSVRVTGNVAKGVLFDTAPVAGVDYDGDGVNNTTDTDDDNDGILDKDDKDLDNDGLVDATEGNANIVQFGSAPAILIGSSTESITIGEVGTGADARGLVIRGAVAANGLFDNISATGVQIGAGPTSTQSTVIEGGIRVQSSITAQAYNADAKSLYLSAGAVADRIDIDGSLFAAVAPTSKPLAAEGTFTAYGLLIDSTASASSIYSNNVITVVAGGEKSDAYAIRDLSGDVSYIENTGSITAAISPTDDADDTDDDDIDPGNETITGKAIAIDVANAKAGVRIRQYGVVDGDDDLDSTTDPDPDADGDGVDDADEPGMVGNINFGAFADQFDLENGAYSGNIAFGAGADVYNIGTATMSAQAFGEITDTDGQLTINVVRGGLTVTNAATIEGTALNVGANGSLIVTADPNAGTNTRFNVDTANLATGAKIGLTVTDLIDGPQSYTIIQTAPGGLTAGTLDQSLLGNSPFIFVARARADTAAGTVSVDLRQRTAAEMNLTRNQGAALDAVYKALGNDDVIRDSFLNADTRDEFLDLYDQMLPDQGEGLFSSLDMLSRTVSRLTATRPDLTQRYGPDSFWIQEVNVQVMRETGVTIGSETKTFGFAGGYEAMGPDGGALGATLAFISAEEKDDVAQVGEETDIALLEAGVYWRRSIGKFTVNARGAGGYAWLNGDRVFVDPSRNVVETANAEWNGLTFVGSLSGSYEAQFGRYYVRPTASLDYLYLREGERTETGTSDATKLSIDERTSSRLSAEASLAFGATFGRDLWWRPEMRVGYRQHLAGEIGDTVFHFKDGDDATLVATEPGDGAVVLGLSLKAGTAMSYVAIEGEYEATDGEDRYNLQLAGRLMY